MFENFLYGWFISFPKVVGSSMNVYWYESLKKRKIGYRLNIVSVMQTEYRTTLRIVSLLLVMVLVSALSAVIHTSLSELILPI